MSVAVIMQPPLPLSASFIDYPYLTAWGSYSAAAALGAAGWQVTVLDGLTVPGATLAESERGFWLGESAAEHLSRLAAIDFDLAVIHASPFLLVPHARDWLKQLVAAAAAAGKPVVLAEMFSGGMHYIESDPKALLEDLPGASLLLRYECEPPLARLRPHTAIPAGEVWENREPFALDDLPPPAWQHMDVEGFYAMLESVLRSPVRPGPFAAAPRRTLPLVSARGCPFACVFCSKNPGLADRRQVRAVPLATVGDWVGRWVADYGVERLIILDELVNFDSERFDGLLAILERHNLRVELPNGLRADRLTDEQVNRLAPRTSAIKVSLESAVPRVQRELLGKNLDPAAVERIAAACHGRVPFEVHCMIGIPGESRADILATLEMAARLHDEYGAVPRLQLAAPLPGTELAEWAGDQGWLVEQPEDPYAAFGERGVLATDDFDPDLLERARSNLKRRTEDPQRKVIVNLTYRCNNHCVFCAVGDRPPENADLTAVIAALRRYRDQGYQLLDIDGGEPSLHEGLVSVIETAKRLGYRRVSVITNGRRTSYAAFAHQLVRAGVDEILISLHAGEASLQDSLTGVPGSFEQTVAGIGNGLAALPSADQLAVNTTVVAENLEHLGALAELLVRLGVRRWNLQLVTPFGRAEAKQVPVEDELRRHLGALLDRPPSGLRLQIINCPPCLLPGHEELAAVDFGKAARDMVFVGAGGENLQGYLAQRRQRTSKCDDCMDALVCAGEYVFTGT